MMPANISVESRYCTREALYRGARRLPSLKWPCRNVDCRSASGKSPIWGRVTDFGRSTAGPAPPAQSDRARTAGPRPPWPDRRSIPGHRASLPCPARPAPCAATMPDLRPANAPPPQACDRPRGPRCPRRPRRVGPAAPASPAPAPVLRAGLAGQNVRSRNSGPAPFELAASNCAVIATLRPQRTALGAVRHRMRPRPRPCMNARIAPGARAWATAAMPPGPRTGPARRPGRAAPVRSARCHPARAGRPAPHPPGAPGRPDRPGRTEP
jgi:translation initiation factor IF-2